MEGARLATYVNFFRLAPARDAIRGETLYAHRVRGESFGIIAEKDDRREGYSTEYYYTFPKKNSIKFPLFFSKFHAERFAERLPNKDELAVFGLPQHKLRILIAIMELRDMKLGLVHECPDEMGWINVVQTDFRQLKKEYLL
jgi:hypothetical protein